MGQLRDKNRARFVNEVMFSLNIGFAVAYSLFAYVANFYLPVFAVAPVQRLLMAFDRWFVHVALLVVSVPRDLHRQSMFIWEFGFLVAMIGVALLLFGFRRMLARTVVGQFMLDPLSGVTALIATPGCWFYIIEITRPRPEFHQSFWLTYGLTFALEMGLVGLSMYLVRGYSLWLAALLILLHSTLWVYVVASVSGAPNISSVVLSPIFPLAGLAWLWYSSLRKQSGCHAIAVPSPCLAGECRSGNLESSSL
jgi:hypothetical protein